MVAGVKFNYSEDDIVDALRANKGNLRATSRMLNCSHQYIYEFIEEHPHLKQILNKIRHAQDDEMLTLCENQLTKAILMIDTKPRIALDAVKFFLDRKGKSRGYGASTDISQQQSLEIQTNTLHETLKKAYEARDIQQQANQSLQRDDEPNQCL